MQSREQEVYLTSQKISSHLQVKVQAESTIIIRCSCCAHGAAGVSKVAGPSLTTQAQETTGQQCTPHSHPNRCEPRPGYHEHNMMYAHSHKQALHKIMGPVTPAARE